jgi:hypothetical protein
MSFRTAIFWIASEDSVSELSHYYETIGPGFAVLVTGPLSYFFAKYSPGGEKMELQETL